VRSLAECLVVLGFVLLTAGCAGPPTQVAASSGTTRTYYVAADEVVWDYAPTGINLTEGRPFTALEKPWMEAGPHVAGRKAKRAL
jgi:hypothetical protein